MNKEDFMKIIKKNIKNEKYNKLYNELLKLDDDDLDTILLELEFLHFKSEDDFKKFVESE